MANLDGVGNLTRNSVRPLRGAVKAQNKPSVQTFSVKDLKSGGSFDVGGKANGTPANQVKAANHGLVSPNQANGEIPAQSDPLGQGSLSQRYQVEEGRSIRGGGGRQTLTKKPPTPGFSVEDLKNGGTLNLSGTMNQVAMQVPSLDDVFASEGQSYLDENTIRQQYQGSSNAGSSIRQPGASNLPMEEQIEQLSKIRKSAVEYEAVFVDQLVKQMRPTPLMETTGSDTLSDIAQQPFRDFLSQAGGMGLADSIVDQVARQEGLEQTLHANPGIMGPGWSPTIAPSLMTKPAGNLHIMGDTSFEGASVVPMNGNSFEGASATPGLSEAKHITRATVQQVGLMSHEEIAYLYKDASQG